MKYYTSNEFCDILKISKKTLERAEKSGEIVPIRKKGKRIRYYTDDHINKYLGIKAQKHPKQNKKKKVIGYYRVSTNSQKRELQNQKQALEQFTLNSGIIIDEYLYDIGSGINFKRKNFLLIIDMIEKQEISKLIITYKDRLTRFAFDLIEERCKVNNVDLIVINLESSSPQQELVEDLMTIMHVFSCRLYGLRKYKNKIKKDLENDFNTQN